MCPTSPCSWGTWVFPPSARDRRGVPAGRSLFARRHLRARTQLPALTRNLTFNGKKYSVPFLICGDGGHNVTALASASFGKKNPEPGDNLDASYMDTSTTVKSTALTLNRHDQQNSGYLRVSVTAQKLTFTFNPVSKTGAAAKTDTVTVDLASHIAA